jgi:DNA-binding IclR family transcriptional regulator
MLPAQPNQSLIDGLSCLQAVISAEEPIGSRELARQLGLDQTRVHRLLKTLAHLGLAEQDERRKYRAGPAIHILAAQSLVGSGLQERAVEGLEELRQHGYFVALGVLWRDQICYVYTATAGSQVTRALTRPRPATTSAMGRALLARYPDTEIYERHVSSWLSRTGEEPPPSEWDELLADINEIRAQGYSVGGEQEDRSLATTVDDLPYAAVGLVGDIPDSEVPGLVEALRQAGARIAHSDRRAM